MKILGYNTEYLFTCKIAVLLLDLLYMHADTIVFLFVHLVNFSVMIFIFIAPDIIQIALHFEIQIMLKRIFRTSYNQNGVMYI